MASVLLRAVPWKQFHKDQRNHLTYLFKYDTLYIDVPVELCCFSVYADRIVFGKVGVL